MVVADAMVLAEGSRVWVSHPQGGWLQGVVCGSSSSKATVGTTLHVATAQGNLEVQPHDAHLQNKEGETVEVRLAACSRAAGGRSLRARVRERCRRRRRCTCRT